MIQPILAMVHDEKQHAVEDLEPFNIYRKSWLVNKYVECCPACDFNRTDRQTAVGSLRPIRPDDPLPMRIIAMDFILALPEVKSAGTAWQLTGKPYFDTYNCMVTISCHASKRTLLIPGNEKYTALEASYPTMIANLPPPFGEAC
ncbi:hypothetical protein F5Y17DRAFT_226148 [Xylariaceae sp. FL0594]|nr:hypothetical protein F5Y17DRAFT_226148 [Xylariaceae sp. FL0594]